VIEKLAQMKAERDALREKLEDRAPHGGDAAAAPEERTEESTPEPTPEPTPEATEPQQPEENAAGAEPPEEKTAEDPSPTYDMSAKTIFVDRDQVSEEAAALGAATSAPEETPPADAAPTGGQPGEEASDAAVDAAPVDPLANLFKEFPPLDEAEKEAT